MSLWTSFLRRLFRDRRGFGHQHEFMVPVAIIGILAAIAIPKFADLIRKSNEGASKGNLGAIRSALSIHYGDHAGWYPFHPGSLAHHGKYLSQLPLAKTPPFHRDSAEVRLGRFLEDADDAGGWLYAYDVSSPQWGSLFVNCTHTDSRGNRWVAY